MTLGFEIHGIFFLIFSNPAALNDPRLSPNILKEQGG